MTRRFRCLDWPRGAAISAQHPIGGRSKRHDVVPESFANVAEIAGGGIALPDARIDAGTAMAVETGVGQGTLVLAGHEARLHHRVTNVCRKVGGVWKLAHHDADLADDLLDVLRELSAAA